VTVKITAEPEVLAWLDAHPEAYADFARIAEEWARYPAVSFPGDPVPRRFAVVRDLDIIVAFGVSDDLVPDVEWVHFKYLEHDPPELWTP
jgi:hypothetical protein